MTPRRRCSISETELAQVLVRRGIRVGRERRAPDARLRFLVSHREPAAVDTATQPVATGGQAAATETPAG